VFVAVTVADVAHACVCESATATKKKVGREPVIPSCLIQIWCSRVTGTSTSKRVEEATALVELMNIARSELRG